MIMTKKRQTPSQTVGPFFAYSLTPEQYSYEYDTWADGTMAENELDEKLITIVGQVFDGEGQPVDDAIVELWQNDGERKYFGRYGTGTDPQHRFFFQMYKPKAAVGMAPFVSVILFMRGQLIHAYTRIYFSDEAARNDGDEILQQVPTARRSTLIAKKEGERLYRFDIHMQGDLETVFFDV